MESEQSPSARAAAKGTPPRSRGGHMKRSLWSIAAVGLLIASACGSDGDSGSDTTAAAGTEAPAETEAPDTTAAAGTEAPASSEAPAGGSSNIQASGECGLGTGEAAAGEPIKLGSIVTNVPGIDFRPIRDMASVVLRLRERERRHQRPADRVRQGRGADRRAADRLPGDEADRAGPGARPRRQHQHHRLRGQRPVLRRTGVLRHHRRRRPGLLHQRQLLGRQHGSVLLQPRWRAGRAPGRS